MGHDGEKMIESYLETEKRIIHDQLHEKFFDS